MDAVIVAAGQGSRLKQGRRPKCLTEIDGRPLIEYQLEALGHAGVERVTVVVGFEGERVQRVLGDSVSYVENPRYADTNSLYSFLLARQRVHQALFVLNSDVLFDPRVPHRLAAHPGSAIAFDSGSGDDAEHMKLATDDGTLVEMSKQLPAEQSDGENLGILQLDRHAAHRAFAAAERLVRRGGERDWLGSAINAVARHRPLGCVDVGDLPWVEIDFPADLRAARRAVLPKIRHGLDADGAFSTWLSTGRAFNRRALRRPRMPERGFSVAELATA